MMSHVDASVKKVIECVSEDRTQQEEDNIFRAFELLGEGDSGVKFVRGPDLHTAFCRYCSSGVYWNSTEQLS